MCERGILPILADASNDPRDFDFFLHGFRREVCDCPAMGGDANTSEVWGNLGV